MLIGSKDSCLSLALKLMKIFYLINFHLMANRRLSYAYKNLYPIAINPDRENES